MQTHTQPPILLPLLRAPAEAANATRPPLHLLPGGDLPASRIAFTTSAAPAGTTENAEVIDWTVTTHVFPAAYPRSTPAATTPPCNPYLHMEPKPLPAVHGSDDQERRKEEKRRRELDLDEWKRREETQKDAIAQLFRPPADEQEAASRAHELAQYAHPQLWSSVQRIVPIKRPGKGSRTGSDLTRGGATGSSTDSGNPQPVTLIFAHANGLHKETWEASLPSLLQSLHGSDTLVEEIWSLDTMGSGQSGILNANHLGEIASWFDGARDIQQFVRRYLPTRQPESAFRRQAGPRWPPAVLKVRNETRHGRRLAAVGHSYSGASLALLSHTATFEAAVLVDPVLVSPRHLPRSLERVHKIMRIPLARGAVARRDVWDNHATAKEYFLTRPFWQAFDRRTLDSYAKFGLRPLHSSDKAGNVTLATPKWIEAAYFGTTLVSAFASFALRHEVAPDSTGKPKIDGDNKADVTKIWAIISRQSVLPDEDRQDLEETLRLRGSRNAHWERAEARHLIVQENPDLAGEKIGNALRKLLSSDVVSISTPNARL